MYKALKKYTPLSYSFRILRSFRLKYNIFLSPYIDYSFTVESNVVIRCTHFGLLENVFAFRVPYYFYFIQVHVLKIMPLSVVHRTSFSY